MLFKYFAYFILFSKWYYICIPYHISNIIGKWVTFYNRVIDSYIIIFIHILIKIKLSNKNVFCEWLLLWFVHHPLLYVETRCPLKLQSMRYVTADSFIGGLCDRRFCIWTISQLFFSIYDLHEIPDCCAYFLK